MSKKKQTKVSSTASNEKIVRYQVVEFTKERHGTKKSYDFVPAKWISFDPKIGTCIAKFMETINTPELSKLMDDLRRTEADAPESWAWYPVVLRGEAENFNDAIKKAETLSRAEYAYSTDNEDHAKEKSIAVMKLYESKTKKNNKNQLEDILSFDKADSNSSDLEPDSVSSDTIINDSDSEATTEVIVPSRKYKKKISPHRNQQQSTKSVCSAQKNGNPLASFLDNSSASSPTVKKSAGIKDSRGANSPAAKVTEPDVGQDTRKRKVISDTEPRASQKTLKATSEKNDIPSNSVHQIDTGISKENSNEILQQLPDGVLKLMYIAIKELTEEMQKNSEDIRHLRQAIEGVIKKKISPVRLDTVVAKFGISLPLETRAQLEDFNQKLVDDEKFCTEFVDVIQHFIEKDICKTVSSISKKLLTRLLAMDCTAVKQTKGKYLLKNTKIYTILFELVCAHHKESNGGEVSERQFRKALSSVIYNAKDWHGNRNQRRKAETPPVDPVQEVAQVVPMQVEIAI